MLDKEANKILKLIGATILGIKPAELINVKIGSGFEECKKILINYPEIHYLKIKRLKLEPRIQTFFYHQSLLTEIFRKKANKRFLIEMGYDPTNKLGENLEILKMRLREDNFPHEIGLFLGYPLKDVLGFMGKFSLELVKVKGWRYYGSISISEKHYNNYYFAKNYFKEVMESSYPDNWN